MASQDKLITANTIMNRLKISRAIFSRITRSSGFPKSQLVSGVGVRWSEQAVNAWIVTQPKNIPLTRPRGAP